MFAFVLSLQKYNLKVVQSRIFVLPLRPNMTIVIPMNTVTDKMPCRTSETEPLTVKVGQDKRSWAQYSQAIAVLMSKRMSELGLTQKMLAEKMDCTQQYISKMLKGQKNMSLETICKIESALGIEIIKGLNKNEK